MSPKIRQPYNVVSFFKTGQEAVLPYELTRQSVCQQTIKQFSRISKISAQAAQAATQLQAARA